MTALVAGALLGQARAADQGKPAAGPKAVAAQTVVTGQDRGYTNDKLYLRLDDDKEITLIVDIPGDKDRKWQNEYLFVAGHDVTTAIRLLLRP